MDPQQQPQQSQSVPLGDPDVMLAVALQIAAGAGDEDRASDGIGWLADKLEAFKRQQRRDGGSVSAPVREARRAFGGRLMEETVRDSLGREQCYDDSTGKHVACHPGETTSAPEKTPQNAPQSAGKAKASRGTMMGAKREGTGKEARIILADGSPAPAHIRPSMVPPDWVDVNVSLDPDADVVVTARDKNGRAKTVTPNPGT